MQLGSDFAQSALECGGAPPLLRNILKPKNAVFRANLITHPCPSQQFPGRTPPPTDFRSAAPTLSQRALIVRLTIFALRSVSRFYTAVFSLSRATSAGNLNLGLYFRIIITLSPIPKAIHEAQAACRKC